MKCQKCGAQVDDQAAFCDKCGATLQKPQAETGPTVSGYGAAAQYAGFWKRLGAFVIDGLILYAVQTVIQIILMGVGVINIDQLMSELEANPETADLGPFMAVMWILGGVMFVVQMFYFAIMESSSKQATLGKMVLGIVVTDADGKRISLGRAFGRNLAKIISTIILLVGYLMIAFTKKEQGLHDMIAGCLVVVKNK